MDLESFLSLSTLEAADLVRDRGVEAIACPINGTRRWYLLEHAASSGENFYNQYLKTAWQKHIDVYRLCFDHGLRYFLNPIIGPDLLARGDDYGRVIEPGLRWLAENPAMLAFYKAYEVKVRIYGDLEKYLSPAGLGHLVALFRELEERTSRYERHVLLFGVFAHDPVEHLASIAIDIFQQEQRAPRKEEMVKAYYGIDIPPVDIFLGSDRPAVFDVPLLLTGQEDLYFMAAPSLYLDEIIIRQVLFDHLFSRKVDDAGVDYDVRAINYMSRYYSLNRRAVLGLGKKSVDGMSWYASPQLVDPDAKER